MKFKEDGRGRKTADLVSYEKRRAFILQEKALGGFEQKHDTVTFLKFRLFVGWRKTWGR